MKKKRILVVDDVESILSVLQFVLSSEFHVETRRTGREALEFLQDGGDPDAIILDINMPEIDGMECLKQIRASGFFQHIPVLMLSGRDTSNDRIKCLEAGADDFIMKPFNPEEVLVRLNNHIKRAQKVTL